MSTEPKNSKSGVQKIIHITDTHLLNDANADFYGFNTKQSFEKVLYASLLQHADADCVLLTGDISQTGEEPSYRHLKTILEKSNLPVYAVPGNHDTPQYLRQVISGSPEETIQVVDEFCSPLVLVNSCKQGSHQGEVSGQSLRALERFLGVCKQSPIVVGIHHPPILTGSEWLDQLGLRNKQELLALFHKYSLQYIVLCGHIHQQLEVVSDNVHIMTTPSTCHQFTPYSQQMAIDQHGSPGFRIIKIKNAKLHESTVHYVA